MFPASSTGAKNIQNGLAAVRLQDTRLAVVDLKGNTVRNLGKGSSALLRSKDFVQVERQHFYEYIDMLSGRSYSTLPQIVSHDEPQMINAMGDSLTLRLKDPFFYGTISSMASQYRPRDYGYFYLIGIANCQCEMKNYAVDTSSLVVFKGDNERAYFLYEVYDDGSIDVIDRQGNGYHVTPDGKRDSINRCVLLDHSLPLLKEITSRYKNAGGDLNDGLVAMKYRNQILYYRLFDKLKALQRSVK